MIYVSGYMVFHSESLNIDPEQVLLERCVGSFVLPFYIFICKVSI